jgi:STAM-binding protein
MGRLSVAISAHLIVILAVTAAANCNPERYAAEIQASEAATLSLGVTPANITFLPQDKGGESPACLDGSPYGFYFRPSPTNSTKWTIFINGGGWCYDEIDCACRANTSLGSSKALPPTNNCACMNPREDGSMDPHCNCLHLPYSDGASFSGFRAKPWKVPGMTQQITFRGIKNFDGVLDFAMEHGMGDASKLVVTGGSAGGLSTFLHTDRAAARVPKAKTRGAPVVGYFLDHDNFKHTTGGQPNTPQWSKPGIGANYTTWMKYVYTMQNMSFGSDGGLAAACQAKHPDQPWLCFMSPHMQDVITTPFFMFNSKYDAWQLGNIFQSRWSSKEEQQGVGGVSPSVSPSIGTCDNIAWYRRPLTHV